MTTANHVLLRRITLSASAASVTFDSIPQTGYTDLKIVFSGRNSVDDISGKISFNGTTTGYTRKELNGNGSTAYSSSASTNTINPVVEDGINFTANTFSNVEIYIPNYASSNYKSFSMDAVTETNAAGAYMGMTAGLWSNTSAVTSIAFTCNSSGSFVSGSSFALYGIANASTTPALAPKADGGDIIKTDGTYWYHAFLSTATFKPQVNLTADILQVAGGGGSGTYGGGGGAGGLLGFTSQSLTNGTSYTCTVGAGGAASTGASGVPTARGTSGGNSQFASLTASVGGGGGGGNKNEDGSTFIYRNGLSGGSGGGAAGSDPGYGTGTGGSGTSGQGYAGGAGSGQTYGMGAGGGGGAGGAGAAGTYSSPATGGVGLSTYSSWGSATGTGENVSGTYYYAGGGGGYANYANGSSNPGGYGGGGNGAYSPGTAGKSNTGGGGGAQAGTGTAGGSGIIIIRYPV